jgi:hypothetical protein
MPGVVGMHIEAPGRRAWPGGHWTPGVGSGIPGVALPGTPGVAVPGIRGLGAPGMVGVVGLGTVGVGAPGAGAPGAGACASAGPARVRPARLRVVTAIVREAFQFIRWFSLFLDRRKAWEEQGVCRWWIFGDSERAAGDGRDIAGCGGKRVPGAGYRVRDGYSEATRFGVRAE